MILNLLMQGRNSGRRLGSIPVLSEPPLSAFSCTQSRFSMITSSTRLSPITLWLAPGVKPRPEPFLVSRFAQKIISGTLGQQITRTTWLMGQNAKSWSSQVEKKDVLAPTTFNSWPPWTECKKLEFTGGEERCTGAYDVQQLATMDECKSACKNDPDNCWGFNYESSLETCELIPITKRCYESVLSDDTDDWESYFCQLDAVSPFDYFHVYAATHEEYLHAETELQTDIKITEVIVETYEFNCLWVMPEREQLQYVYNDFTYYSMYMPFNEMVGRVIHWEEIDYVAETQSNCNEDLPHQELSVILFGDVKEQCGW